MRYAADAAKFVAVIRFLFKEKEHGMDDNKLREIMETVRPSGKEVYLEYYINWKHHALHQGKTLRQKVYPYARSDQYLASDASGYTELCLDEYASGTTLYRMRLPHLQLKPKLSGCFETCSLFIIKIEHFGEEFASYSTEDSM